MSYCGAEINQFPSMLSAPSGVSVLLVVLFRRAVQILLHISGLMEMLVLLTGRACASC